MIKFSNKEAEAGFGCLFLMAVYTAIMVGWLYILDYPKNQDGNSVFEAIFCSFLTLALLAFLVSKIREKIKGECDDEEINMGPEENIRNVKDHMFFIMQHGRGIEGVLREFNEIFTLYPLWRLQYWVVFRSWYKAQIDHMIERPEIYGMKFKGGDPYSKEEDPLYDPDAPDWSLYEYKQNYDDKYDSLNFDDHDDDDYDDDDYNDYDNDFDNKRKLKKAAEDGLDLGIGFGIADNILNN